MKIKTLRGFKDILPEETAIWQFVEDKAKEVFELFGFSEIRPPIIEYTEIFTRSLGTNTDIVEKEMYTFNDRDGSSVTLRPEGTASVVRSYIENALHLKSPVSKLYYIGPMFRHERPQKGRYRNFHQIGIELFGSEEPEYDAELINMLVKLYQELGVSDDIKIEISSLGDYRCRPGFKSDLIKYFTSNKEKLCEDCKKKLHLNPLRILDCKNTECKKIAENSPSILEYLCQDCDNHFKKVISCLELLQIEYVLNPHIVRGLDYYNRTVFEFTTNKLGSQNAVAAGGRYDGLVKELGGPDIPAVGFAMGIERLVLLIKETNIICSRYRIDIYIAYMNIFHLEFAFKITDLLRKNGLRVEIDYNNKSLKSKLKRANKINAAYTIIIGEEEYKRNNIMIKNMETSLEKEISIEDVYKITQTSLMQLF
jgi:histidyl-tRNA synthetase